MLTQWDKIKAAQRMQEYVEAHLQERISMASLARAARYSQWHAARIFKEITGKSPFEYIRLRRLSVAAETLQTTSHKVIDVAFDFVFDSHEGFTRAFARQFGMSSAHFRKTNQPVPLFMPPRLRDWYMRRQRGEYVMAEKKNTETVFVQILDRPARKAIIKRGINATHYFEYCEEVGCDVWDILATISEALQEPVGMWLPESLQSVWFLFLWIQRTFPKSSLKTPGVTYGPYVRSHLETNPFQYIVYFPHTVLLIRHRSPPRSRRHDAKFQVPGMGHSSGNYLFLHGAWP